MSSTIRFQLDGQPVTIDSLAPTSTLLRWLRATGRTGTKEGCNEGDCGACTVILVDPQTPARPRAINSCLVLLPQLHGMSVTTVEGLARGDSLHPAQQAMVDALGSQCGYCTPGFVMSLVEACHRPELAGAAADDWRLDDQICGNLCRCTGYRPIRDALRSVAGTQPADGLDNQAAPEVTPDTLDYEVDGQRFLAPTALDEVLRIRSQHPEARIVTGATDLGLDITKKHATFSVLLHLGRVAELSGIEESEDTVSIGACTPLSDLEDWAAEGLPVLHRMLRYFGSRQIKHRGTIGGNLCTASPIGDIAPVMLALDAEVELVSVRGRRRVPMPSFFQAYRQIDLAGDEVMASVHIPRPAGDTRLGAYKVSRRREMDISAVSACFAVREQGGMVVQARVAYGGVAATPVRIQAAEQALLGRALDADAIEAAVAAVQASITPMDDHRGSAWFRRTLAGNLLRGFYDETSKTLFQPLSPQHTGTVLVPGDAVEGVTP